MSNLRPLLLTSLLLVCLSDCSCPDPDCDPTCLPSCVVGYVSSVLYVMWGGCLDGVLTVKGFSLLSLDCWQEQGPYYR